MLVLGFYVGIAIMLAFMCICVEILLIMVFSKRYFAHNKPLSILFLIIALVFILISDSFGLLGMFIPKDHTSVFTFFSEGSFVATILSEIVFLIFYEIFDSNTLFGLKQLFFSLIGTITLVSCFLHTQTIVYNPFFDLNILVFDQLTTILNKLLPVLIGITVLATVYKNYPLAWKKQKRQLLFLGIGAFIGYITPHVFIEPFQTLIVGAVGPSLFMVLVRVWVALGFILYWYSFGNAKFFGFLQRQHAQELLMIAEGGIPLYSYNFHDENKVLEDEMLFGGAITAIGSLFKETLGKSNVKDITLDDGRKLLFQPFDEKGFSLILITPLSSIYLIESIKRFGDKIGNIFTTVDKLSDNQKIADNGDLIISDCFGIPH